VGAALATWNQAESAAIAAREERVSAAVALQNSVLAGLQSQANEAYEEYLDDLAHTGCAPGGGGPVHFVSYPINRASFDSRAGTATDERGQPRPLTWGEWILVVLTDIGNDPSNLVMPLGMAKAPAVLAFKGSHLARSRAITVGQKALDHIVLRHWPTSGAQRVGKFLQGTRAKDLIDMIKTATSAGTRRPNTAGRPGSIFEYDFGRIIGTDIEGKAATKLRVVVGPDGNVITAFPY